MFRPINITADGGRLKSYARSRLVERGEGVRIGWGADSSFENESQSACRVTLTALRDDPLQSVDAAVCVNDMMALGAVNALLARGVRVPEDVAVAGYDDVIFSRVSPVPITTVRQNVRALAAAAVDRLLDMIEHRDPAETVTLLPCTLIERESTGTNAR